MIIKGIFTGLAYGLLLGPLFFLVLETTLKRGFSFGLALVGGAFVSDQLLVFGSWQFSAQVAQAVQAPWFQPVFGGVGGLILAGFGLPHVLPHSSNVEAKPRLKLFSERRWAAFLQGFLVNMINPSNWLFWLGLAASTHADAQVTHAETGAFLYGAAFTLFTTDLIKLSLAGRLGQWLTPQVVRQIARGSGFILIGLGLWIFVKSVFIHS